MRIDVNLKNPAVETISLYLRKQRLRRCKQRFLRSFLPWQSHFHRRPHQDSCLMRLFNCQRTTWQHILGQMALPLLCYFLHLFYVLSFLFLRNWRASLQRLVPQAWFILHSSSFFLPNPSSGMYHILVSIQRGTDHALAKLWFQSDLNIFRWCSRP